MATIGFDFGSLYCTVCWYNLKSSQIEPIKMTAGDGTVKFPTLVVGTKTGIKNGKEALSIMDLSSSFSSEEQMKIVASSISAFRQKMQVDGEELFYGKVYSHKDILKSILNNIKTQAQSFIGGEPIDSVVWSYPLEMDDARKQMMQQVWNELGCHTIDKVEEPIAAVYGYSINHKIEEGMGVLVFDFGGTSIDVAYVSNELGKYKIIFPPEGNNSCGGQDLDSLLYKYFLKQIAQKCSFNTSQMEFIINASILNACQSLKQQICKTMQSQKLTRTIVLDNTTIDYTFELSYEKFVELTETKIEEAIQFAEKLIFKIKNSNRRLDKVLLIGGSSQIPFVRNRLSEMAGCDVTTCGKDDITISSGCIKYALEKGYIRATKQFKTSEAKQDSSQKTNAEEAPNTKQDQTLQTEQTKHKNTTPEKTQGSGVIVVPTGLNEGELKFNW